jgi:hypothetical protein
MPWRHMGEWMYSSTILDLGTTRTWVVSFTPRVFCLWGNRPRYPLDGWAQSRSGRCGGERNLSLTGNRVSAVQPVALCYTDWAIQTRSSNDIREVLTGLLLRTTAGYSKSKYSTRRSSVAPKLQINAKAHTQLHINYLTDRLTSCLLSGAFPSAWLRDIQW